VTGCPCHAGSTGSRVSRHAASRRVFGNAHGSCKATVAASLEVSLCAFCAHFLLVFPDVGR